MKIALLTETIFPFDIGGIQKHSYFLAKGLAVYDQVYKNKFYKIKGFDYIFTKSIFTKSIFAWYELLITKR